MTRKTVVVGSEHGIHLRAAARIVQITTPARCPVWLSMGATTVDAKSLLGITSLVASKGTELVVSASGPGEDQVVEALAKLIEIGLSDEG
jgi:phosphocarrier protein HPr